ncbi:MAG: helix-turn-helix transcriptional regulator [Reichenbachiella sp.]|uniref:PadR family transcriptional regulator n=1 Tax=Reichenbachiella sp. TaxID=2184521 RepID=UPI00326497B3
MKKYQLGEFEEVVLLTVAVLYNDAYGVSIRQEIEEKMKRKVSVSALQTALRRMESKGFLDSRFGQATAVRGGKRKRLFAVTPLGKDALEHAKDTRMKLWESIPSIAFDFGN